MVASSRSTAILSVVVLCLCIPAAAQVNTPEGSSGRAQSAPVTRKSRQTEMRSRQVIVESRSTAPQVVTVLHRLNGIKMFRLLLRSSEGFGAISKLDPAFKMADEVHTNVIAGLSMEDGQTIVAWLPDVEAEMGPLPTIPFAPGTPTAPPAPEAPAAPNAPLVMPRVRLAGPMSLFDRPDLTVIARDGQRLNAKYVGIDGGTGLSILKLSEKTLLPAAYAKEESVGVGQRVRLVGPEPVAKPETSEAGTVFARVGETEGTVVGIARAPSGAIARVRIRSPKLSAAHIGGIAVNVAGETVGIVDAVESNEATVMPSALVRSAVKRVVERQASVPRPWLGISGEPVESLGFEEIVVRGWQQEVAKSLAKSRRGIMLTSVVPGSPAADASLRAGDVILLANQEEIRTADDLSWLLEEVGPGAEVRFTVARPDKSAPEAINLTLSEAPNSFFALKWPEEARTPGVPKAPAFSGSLISSKLIGQGIETIALKPMVAARFGAASGLLVVYVHPTATAYKAGLRSGDVIEAIDGQAISSPSLIESTFLRPGSTYSFNVVRNRQKVEVKVVTPESQR